MADENHLKIFKSGITLWNRWRKINPKIEPDLSNSDLSDLGFNLANCNLSRSNLSHCNLSKTTIRKVNLSYSDLTKADLKGATFVDINFRMANFSSSILSFVNLAGAKILGADFSFANLSNSVLTDAIFSDVNLTGADFSHASFLNARLSNCSLRKSNLTYADLRQTTLRGVKLTGAILYNFSRPGWDIEDIECDFVFLDEEGEEKYPRNGFFDPKEFELRFRTKIATIEFVFDHGMNPYDPFLMDWIAEKIREDLPHLGITLLRIEKRGIKPSAVFEVASKEVREQALIELRKRYEETIEILKLQNEQSEKRNQQLMEYTGFLLRQISQPKQITNQILIQEYNMGDKYVVGQAGAVGPQSQAQGMTFTQELNQLESSVDLTRLAGELSTLLQLMKQEANKPEHHFAVSEIIEAEQAAKAGDGAKAIQYLKSAGKWILDFVSKIGASIIAEILKKDMDVK